MKDFVLVNVLQTKTDLDKELPDFLLFKRLFILHLEVHWKIAIVAILHNNMQGIILNEGLLVLDDEGMNEFAHDGGFV